MAPEFDPVVVYRLALRVQNFFHPDAVRGTDPAAICDGVGALDGFPGVVLGVAELFFLGGVPADGGGIEEDFSSLQRRQSRGFGVPLVPADQHADLRVGGAPGAKTGVTRSEIEFFVIERIVRDMHFAIDTGDGAIGFDDGGSVVIEAGGAFFEEGGDDDNFVFAGDFGKQIGARSGDRFG